jgi:uncharacterized damage-inducible protein DinB
MSQIPVWFDRKFNFSFPAELYPNICSRLRGTPARLEEMLESSDRELVVKKPMQKWSAQEHAGHLLDLEPLWLARLEDYVKGSGQLSVTDLQNRKTNEANYNAQPLKQILAQFRASRNKLLARAEEVDTALHSQSIPHPRLKVPMRLVDHLYFVAEHDDHHLGHIWELVGRELVEGRS